MDDDVTAAGRIWEIVWIFSTNIVKSIPIFTLIYQRTELEISTNTLPVSADCLMSIDVMDCQRVNLEA